MSTSPAELRQAVADVAGASSTELRRLWSRLDTADADGVREALVEVVPALVDEHGTVAAALTADYYDEAREDARVSGRFRARPVDPAPSARVEAMVRWGVGPLFSEQPDPAAALERLSSGQERIVTDFQRETIVDSVERDPQARGWQRVGSGRACPFCSMLIGRGGVYRSGGTAAFRSHNNCRCVAVPSWDATAAPVSEIAYRASKRERTDADRAALRKYLRENFSD